MSAAQPSPSNSKRNSRIRNVVFVVAAVPVLISVLVFRYDEFDAAQLPEQSWSWSNTVSVPIHHNRILNLMERIGDGVLLGPEDLAYDEESGVIYTGCSDGWIKRIRLTESGSSPVVENWVHVGGRPLGLAFGPDKELIVAEAHKGLLKVTRDGKVNTLTVEVEGKKFGLINGVAVAQNGVIYFTDASHKYNLSNFILNTLEGRPYGRLISFDPSINQTQVLVQDLYFPNGIAISPDQQYLVMCETTLRMCKKYYIEGKNYGTTVSFIDGLPGYPDNIHYDGEENFWIALTSGKTTAWNLFNKFPILRKVMAIMTRYVDIPHVLIKDGGVIAVNLDGEPVVLYSDPGLAMISSGIKINGDLYFGSLGASYMSRLKLAHFTLNNV